MSTRADLPRLALSSWSHDWLTRREAPRGEYRALPRVLDELCERGYNALRVDAFPHLVANVADGVTVERFELLGPRNLWVTPRKQLVELATLARERNLRLWLTSSFLNDTQARRAFVRRPRDYIDVWSQTLHVLGDAGALEAVAAVDFCHEFTSPDTTRGAWRSLFPRHPLNPLARLAEWSRETEQAVERYLLDVPRGLRALFPEIAFGVSVAAQTESRLRKLDTTELDFIDTHLWLDDDPRIGLMTGAPLALTGNPLARALQTRVAGLAWRARGMNWLRAIDERFDGLGEFARLRRLQPVVAGGYVHVASERQADWAWVKDVSEAMINTALGHGVSCLVTAQQARPHSEGLWQDIDWHRDMTRRILTGPGR